MPGQRSGRIFLGNPEAGNATVIRILQKSKGGAGYCDSLDTLLQWSSAPFTAGDAIPLSIQIKGAGLVIRAFLSRFEIPRPRPSSTCCAKARLYCLNHKTGLSMPLALAVSISVNHPHMLSANSGLCLKPLAARSTVRVRTARSLRLVSGTSRGSSKNALSSF